MKRRKLFLLISALALTLLLAGFGLAADGGSQTETRYFYQVEQVPGVPGSFSLYVERTDAEGAPLHAGSIALADYYVGTTALSFTPADGWKTVASQYAGAPSSAPVETGTLSDGRQYISFSWYWDDNDQELPGEYDGNPNRQFLGTLSGINSSTVADDIELLAWPETKTGAEAMQAWSTTTDKEAFKEILDSFWRMPNLNDPDTGYYQGYYATDGTDGESQYAVDLTAYWQGFTIGAYAPEKSATLLFYKSGSLYASAAADFGTGTGHFKGKIDFSKLTLNDPAANEQVSLEDGVVYDIVILKPSHVQCTIKNVEYDASTATFPELQGTHVEIPCGDLVVSANAELQNIERGDGAITLQDRSVLQACLNGGIAKGENEYTFADLNGDGAVSLADLDILMSAENYNKKSITIEGKGAGT